MTRQQSRDEEFLARCSTDAQRATCLKLQALDKDFYPEQRMGKTVIAEFRRYCETCDASKIGEGLYRLSMGGAGGFNDYAHYSLQGYRADYPHPAIYIEQVIVPEVNGPGGWHYSYREDPLAYHEFTVYKDGMTSGEVAHAIVKLAKLHRKRLLEDLRDKRRAAELAEAERLAGRLGLKLVSVE